MITKPIGRPLRDTTPSNQTVTIRLSERESELLDVYSERYNLSKSDSIRFACDVIGVW